MHRMVTISSAHISDRASGPSGTFGALGGERGSTELSDLCQRRPGLRRPVVHGGDRLSDASARRAGALRSPLHELVRQLAGLLPVAGQPADRPLSRQRGRPEHPDGAPRHARAARQTSRRWPRRSATRGYRTGLVGKWHLGAAEGTRPADRGFDESFGHLGGAFDFYSHLIWGAANRESSATARRGSDSWCTTSGRTAREVWRDGEYATEMFGERAVQFVRQGRPPRAAVLPVSRLQRAAPPHARARAVQRAVPGPEVGSSDHGGHDQRDGRPDWERHGRARAPGRPREHPRAVPERQRPVSAVAQLAGWQHRLVLRRLLRATDRPQVQSVRGRHPRRRPS